MNSIDGKDEIKKKNRILDNCCKFWVVIEINKISSFSIFLKCNLQMFNTIVLIGMLLGMSPKSDNQYWKYVLTFISAPN